MSQTPPAVRADLDAPFTLTPQQIAHYREKGFIKLKNVLSPQVIAYYGPIITKSVVELNTQTVPIEQRSTYGKAFLQVMNLWEKSEDVKEFVLGKRLGRIAAELMGVEGVRLYHDQALYKEAGGGITPWHADQYYWPLTTDKSVTAWIPLQAVPKEMGPLAFSAGSQKFNASGRDLEISDESERRLSKALLESGLPLIEEPFDLGEVSFHAGWTFHRAGPNTSGKPREVMTIIYMDEAMHVSELKSKAHHADLARWMPGLKPGDRAASPLNPVIYQG